MPTESLNEAFEVWRQRHREEDLRLRQGMHEAKLGRVQCQARSTADIVDGRGGEGLSVLHVAANQMALFREMDANLIGPARFEPAFDEAVVAELLHPAEVRDGALADLGVARTAAPAVAPVAGDVSDDGAVADRLDSQWRRPGTDRRLVAANSPSYISPSSPTGCT